VPSKKRISQGKFPLNSTRTSIKKTTQLARPSHLTSERPSQNLGDTLKSQFARGTELSYNPDSEQTTIGGMLEARHPQINVNSSLPTEVKEVPEETPKAQIGRPAELFAHPHLTRLSDKDEHVKSTAPSQAMHHHSRHYPMSTGMTESMSYCNDPNCL